MVSLSIGNLPGSLLSHLSGVVLLVFLPVGHFNRRSECRLPPGRSPVQHLILRASRQPTAGHGFVID